MSPKVVTRRYLLALAGALTIALMVGGEWARRKEERLNKESNARREALAHDILERLDRMAAKLDALLARE